MYRLALNLGSRLALAIKDFLAITLLTVRAGLAEGHPERRQ